MTVNCTPYQVRRCPSLVINLVWRARCCLPRVVPLSGRSIGPRRYYCFETSRCRHALQQVPRLVRSRWVELNPDRRCMQVLTTTPRLLPPSPQVDGLNPTRSSVRMDGHAWCAELQSSRAELQSGRSRREPARCPTRRGEPYGAVKGACPSAVSGATTAAGVVSAHRALDTALDTMKTLARARSTVDPRASSSAVVSAGVRGSGGGRGLKAGRGEARTSPRPAWGVGYSGGGAQ